jgi:Rieske Fe-S protein
MTGQARMSRRAVLISAAVGAVTLAACTAARQSGVTGSPSAGAAGEQLATLGAVPIGEAVVATDAAGRPITGSDGRPILVARPTADTGAAFSSKCTHLGCTVAPAGKQLHCPCHGSVFNATTGAVIRGPAPRPLARVEVHLVNGAVIAA